MKKVYKILLFTFILLFFIFIENVHANTFHSVTMDIKIDNDGNAHVKEVWDYTANENTENYHSYNNIGNSTFTNFTVRDETRTYTNISAWNIDASFQDKAYKCGINYTSEGVELCWGISSYGRHTYTLNYTITNFVSELTDSQMVYWGLIPSGSVKEKVYIKIYSDFDYSNDTPVWGYGNKGGTCYVYDGYIEMEPNGKLKSDEYMTILVKFPKGTFNTSNILDYDFDHYLNLAEQGAKHYKQSIFKTIFKWIAFGVPVLLVIFFGFMVPKDNQYNYGETGNKVPKDTPNFRDIPCKGDIFRAYFIANNYNLMKKKTDFLGAVLLKWLKENKISLRKQEVGKVFKKEDTTIILNNTIKLDNSYEKELYDMFYEASKDGILEEKEFERWCTNHYSKILDWFDNVLDYERDELIKEGIITKETIKKFGFTANQYVVNPSLMEEAKELKGLKQFLEEFTLIDKREAIEVELFEQYLMFAQILGIAKQVASQFKKLYPDIIKDYSYDYDDVILLHSISDSGINKAYSARSRAESYSSGGGGFSSGGGRRRLIWWRRPEWVLDNINGHNCIFQILLWPLYMFLYYFYCFFIYF